MTRRAERTAKPRASGNLRIGDHWNAITIIALSQSNPLKAVAELVENSIDARAKTIVITRGKDKGQHYLRVKDDGEGVRRNADGEPDFHYVATHVCDSIKRRLKTQGTQGLQGEFGIGLLELLDARRRSSADFGGRRRARLADASSQRRPELPHHSASGAFPGAGNRGADPRHPARHQELQRREDPVVPRFGAARPHPSFRGVDPRGRSHGAGGVQGRAAAVRGTAPARARWHAAGAKRGLRRALLARAFAGQRRVAVSLGDASAREHRGARSLCTPAMDERLCARDYRRAVSQPDAGDAAWRRPRCRARASCRRAGAARDAACQDHRRPAARGGRAGEPRRAALGAGRAQGGAAGASRRGVRLVRFASRGGQAPAEDDRRSGARRSGAGRRAGRLDGDAGASPGVSEPQRHSSNTRGRCFRS